MSSAIDRATSSYNLPILCSCAFLPKKNKNKTKKTLAGPPWVCLNPSHLSNLVSGFSLMTSASMLTILFSYMRSASCVGTLTGHRASFATLDSELGLKPFEGRELAETSYVRGSSNMTVGSLINYQLGSS